MTDTVSIFIPVFRGVLHAYVESGLQWSVVEHLVLFGLSENAMTADEMVVHSGLHTSVVLESATRLMRAGWVELISADNCTRFRASIEGCSVVLNDSLPAVIRRRSRNLHYLMDRTAGELLNPQGLVVRPGREVRQSNPSGIISHRSSDEAFPGYIELIERMSAFPSITHSDERIVGCDVEKSSLSEDWYVETAVSGESIEGFPRGASRKLRELVLRSAGFNEADITTQAPEDESAEDSSGRVHAIELLEDDLIVGGAAHKATLRSVIADARQRVFIHSTFLSLKNLEEIQDVLESAADLDVRVDVFWDKEEDNERHAEIYAACRQFACRPEFKGLVRISDFPTRSHSKVILADDGRGEYFCVIGSCNWLTSPFKSFEMSVRLRSPSIVSDCSGFLERLIPLGWHDLELRRELLEMSRRLRSAPAKQGLGKARLLLQGDHEGLVRRARDKANRRIFVASNKAGAAVENQVLAPFDSIESTRKVEVAVYYQSRREDSGLTPSVMQALKDQYSRIKIRAVVGAHAKLLSWDSDHAVVTSLNWLSKDASHSNPVGEFGVYIESPGIAEKVENLYLQSCPPSLQ